MREIQAGSCSAAALKSPDHFAINAYYWAQFEEFGVLHVSK